MKVVDLTKRKNQKVTVRVPANRRATFGETAKGVVEGIEPRGGVVWVRVRVPRKGVHRFRPQDLTAA